MEAATEGKSDGVSTIVAEAPLVGVCAASCCSDTSSVSGDEEPPAKQDPNEAFCEVCRGGESVKVRAWRFTRSRLRLIIGVDD